MSHRVTIDHSSAESSNVRIFVRIRPTTQEDQNPAFISRVGDDTHKLSIREPAATDKSKWEHNFSFDYVFWPGCGQEDVYNAICRPQVEHCMQGLNSCCFAYGATGSGKTYNMFGESGNLRGMIPRCAAGIFEAIEKKKHITEAIVICSFLEIYCDQIRDLGKAYCSKDQLNNTVNPEILASKTSEIFWKIEQERKSSFARPPSRPEQSKRSSRDIVNLDEHYASVNHEIREDAFGNVFIQDLTAIKVDDTSQVMDVVMTGIQLRATHETKLNASSSRSHTIFSMTVLQRNKTTNECMSGKINLVDLAGSERLSKSESEGRRLMEARHINASLTALGKVVLALNLSSESSHTPYRDSKLTRILQNSLGGNSYTCLLATVHPQASSANECLGTLQFANRCKNIQSNPRVNFMESLEGPIDKDRLIMQLQESVAALRKRCGAAAGGGYDDDEYDGGDVDSSDYKLGGTSSSSSSSRGGLKLSHVSLLLGKLRITHTYNKSSGLIEFGSHKIVLTDANLVDEEIWRRIRDAAASVHDGSQDSDDKPSSGSYGSYSRHSSREQLRKSDFTAKDEEIGELRHELQMSENKSLNLEQQLLQAKTESSRSVTNYQKRLDAVDSNFKSHTAISKLQQDKDHETFEKTIKSIVDNSNEIQRRREEFNKQREVLSKLPVLETADARPLASSLRLPLSARQSLTQEMEARKSADLDIMRRHYENKLKEMEDTMLGLNQELSEYKRRKKSQMRAYAREMVALFQSGQLLSQVVSNADGGRYRICQTYDDCVSNASVDGASMITSNTHQKKNNSSSKNGECRTQRLIIPHAQDLTAAYLDTSNKFQKTRTLSKLAQSIKCPSWLRDSKSESGRMQFEADSEESDTDV